MGSESTLPNGDFLVVASQAGKIQARHAHDGSLRWTQSRGHPFAGCALARVGNELVAAGLDGYVCALALEDGTVRWEVTVPLAAPIPSPIHGPRIAANQGLVAVQLGKRIFALDMVDGHTIWETKPGASTYAWWLLAVGAEHVYTLQIEHLPARPNPSALSKPHPSAQLPPNAPSFVTTAFSTWDGTPQWFAYEESAVEPPWDGASSLVEADGVVYVYGRVGLYALAAESGTLLWTCDSVPRHPIGALAVGPDYVAFAANTHVGVYRRDTGLPLWSETAQPTTGYAEWFDAPLALDDSVVVFRRTPRRAGFQLEAHESATGGLRWVWSPESDGVQTDVTWRYRGAGSTLYVPSRDDLWGIQAADGCERWHLPYDLDGFQALLAVALA